MVAKNKKLMTPINVTNVPIWDSTFTLGVKKTPVVPVSYREKIRVGRSEINFVFKYFFHGFGVFLLGNLQ
jgi:hypothetical protein